MVGDRSRGDASRRDSESPRREDRRQDRLGRVLGSMLGSAQTVNTNPGSQEARGARHTLQRKARSRRVDVGNAYPAKSQLEGAVRDGSHN